VPRSLADGRAKDERVKERGGLLAACMSGGSSSSKKQPLGAAVGSGTPALLGTS